MSIIYPKTLRNCFTAWELLYNTYSTHIKNMAAGRIIQACGLQEYTTRIALFCDWPHTAHCPNEMKTARSPETEPPYVIHLSSPQRRDA